MGLAGSGQTWRLFLFDRWKGRFSKPSDGCRHQSDAAQEEVPSRDPLTPIETDWAAHLFPLHHRRLSGPAHPPRPD